MSDETMVGVNGVTNFFVSRQASESPLSRSNRRKVATELISRVVAIQSSSSPIEVLR